MIIDKIENISKYIGLTKNLDSAIKYVEKGININIENGVHEIVGKQVYAVAAEYKTKDFDSSKNEAHKKYIDIQILLKGEEIVFASNTKDLIITEDYNDEKDVLFFEKTKAIKIDFEKEIFCIFFPWDAHMPGVKNNKGMSEIKKVVLKVHV